MKRLILLITTILLITGCKEKQIEKFHLNNKYYNEGNYINIKNLNDLEKDTYVEEGKIVAYLDANDDKDLDKYQDSKIFEEWINKYIYTEESN